MAFERSLTQVSVFMDGRLAGLAEVSDSGKIEFQSYDNTMPVKKIIDMLLEKSADGIEIRANPASSTKNGV